MRELVIDTETTGLDPEHDHRMVEICCLEVINKRKTGKVFHYYLNPERYVPKEAEKIHGLTTEFLADKPSFASIAKEFLEFIGRDTLVIHNAGFDMKFINFQLGLHKFEPIKRNKIVDTLILARKTFPGHKANLDALCKRFKISLSRRVKHGALLDAELLAEIYILMTGETQTNMQFDEVEKIIDVSQIKKRTKNLPPRAFLASNQELVEHGLFISKLSNPLWIKQ